MANQTLTTNPVTFLDYTDERKLDVYISSNFPTTQIFDTNQQTYSPNWSTTNPLVLTADVYLDAKDVTADAKTDIKWFEQVGTNSEVEINYGDTLIIDSNKMASNALLTYICKAKYDDNGDDSPIAIAKLTFTRVDTGINGSDGADAPAVLAQYSVDGTMGWTSTLDTATHKYVRYSYDGGTNYTSAIKMAGEDGTSVVIKGTAYTPDALVAGQTVRLYSDSSNTTAISTSGLSTGDSYLVSGYLCVYNEDNISFVCTGTIQGPKGSDGVSSYVFIRYATDASGTGISTNPSGKTYMGVYTSNTNTPPTNASSYTWSKFVGESAKSIILSGDSQVFKGGKTTPIAYTPNTIRLTANRINIPTTTILTWSYNHNDNKGWTTVKPSSVTVSGDVATITGALMTTDSLSIKVSDGTVEDIFTVYRAFDGADGGKGDPASMAFLTNENVSFSANANGIITASSITTNVVAYRGVTKQMPTVGDITPPNGMVITKREDTLLNEMELTISFVAGTDLGSSASTSGTITIPITAPVVTNLKLSWSKINTGATGATGSAGADAYTVILTNESHVFAGDISNAIAGQATTQVLAYKGTTAQTVTISSVNGKTAAIIDTDTGIAGLKFKCSALSGTSPTITFTCTTAFVSASGSIPIVLSVGGVSFTKMFTYSIAFKGATGGIGGAGPAGTPATSYWLVSSASAVQKTSTSTVVTIPSTLTFTGKSQTGTNAPINYACRWVIDYSTDGTNYTNLSTSAANEVSKSITVATTYKTIRARMYMAGGTTSLLDEQIIPVISDGTVDLTIGGRNLLLNSGIPVTNSTYNIKSYQLSVTPTVGEQYTLTLKGTLGTSKNSFTAYNSGGNVALGSLYRVGTSDIYRATFTWANGNRTDLDKSIYMYTMPNSITAESTIEWIKLEKGNKATDWSPAPEDLKSITFQLYAPKGYLLTNDIPELTLQTFAYDGSQAITNATFAWYSWSGEAWTAISGATSTSLTLNKASVLRSNVYKCEMTYNSKVYTATATVEDKTDIYESLIRVTAKYSSTNRMYWVLYTTVYSEDGERDPLLGPISETAPTSATAGAYWYKVDTTNYAVTLMKYSGTAWVATTDTQELLYDWFLFKDAADPITLGTQSKVKMITASDFSRVCSVQCNIYDSAHVLLSRNSQALNDPSDPIISTTAPTNPIDGQIWINIGANGTYVLSIWNATTKQWVVSDADSQNKVYVSKPTQYTAGDIWIVGGDYQPTAYVNGVAQTTKHLSGTMLKAQYGSTTYKDADWVEALNYQAEIDELKEKQAEYDQFFTFDDTGLTMGAKSSTGQISEFKTKLTNTELGFYQGEDKVAYINNNQLNISKAEISNGLSITGASPILTIGDFSIIQEANGSLSFVSNN